MNRDDDGTGKTMGDDHVLRLADIAPVRPDMIVAGLKTYWRSLCRGRAIPERSDVDPRGIREALDYAFILERVAPGAARFRLTGRHLLDLMGMEVRGMPLCAVIEPGSRGRLSDVLETVFRAPQIAELALTSSPGYARPALEGRMLLLPLRSDLGDVTRVLGCLVTGTEIGRAPRRFDITSERLEPVIEGARVLAPQPSAHDRPEAAADWRPRPPPPVETESPFAPAPAPASPAPMALTPQERRARFRVIDGDGAAHDPTQG